MSRGYPLSRRELRTGYCQTMGCPGENFPAPDAAHRVVKIGWDNAGNNRQVMTPGVTVSLRAADGVVHMIWLPGDGHHAVAQNPPNGLGREPPQGVFQHIA